MGRTIIYCAGVALLAGCAPLPPEMNAAAPDYEAAPARPIIHADTEEDLFPNPVQRTYFRLEQLRSLLHRIRGEGATFPETLAGAPTPLREQAEGFSTDAWGEPIQYRGLGDDFSVRSAGPDRILGTTDDLVLNSADALPVIRQTPAEQTPVRLRSLRIYVTVYHGRQGRLPETLDDLARAGHQPTLGLEDGWGRRFRYVRVGDSFELRSAGADGEFHTGDDYVMEGLEPLLEGVEHARPKQPDAP